MEQGNGFLPWRTTKSGASIPPIGLGCAQIEDYGRQDELIALALKTGYRLFDTATLYENEPLIGAALKRSGYRREDYLMSSKLPPHQQGFDPAMRGLENSLKAMDTEYLDIYLIHFPLGDPVLTRDTWRAFESAYEQKLVRMIGVSNFHESHLRNMLSICNVPPMINQIEFNPYLSAAPLRRFCEDNDIIVEGYFPLGGQVVGSKGIRQAPPEVQLFDNKVILELAEKYGKTSGQVILRWEMQSGVTILPKTTKAERIAENYDIFDFSLSDEDMALMDGLNMDYRIGPDDNDVNAMEETRKNQS